MLFHYISHNLTIFLIFKIFDRQMLNIIFDCIYPLGNTIIENFMKTIYIEKKNMSKSDMLEFAETKHLFLLLNEYKAMESPIVYFSAGDAKIKELLVKRDPTISV